MEPMNQQMFFTFNLPQDSSTSTTNNVANQSQDLVGSTTMFGELNYSMEGSVPQTFAQTNPASDNMNPLRVISPVHADQESTSGGMMVDLSGDWGMENSGSNALHPNPIEPTPLPPSKSPSLYSFYFEENTMDHDHGDANSVSLHDDISLEDEDYCLEDIRDDPDSFWAKTPLYNQQETNPSEPSAGFRAFDSLKDEAQMLQAALFSRLGSTL